MAVAITDATWTGSLAHNTAITITGTGFTTKATAAPHTWDTVDNRAEYSALNDGDAIPLTYWELNPVSDIKYETSDPQRGQSTAFYKGIDTGAEAGSPSIGGRTLSGATMIYISWWVRSDLATIGGTGHSSKFIRLNGVDWHQNAGEETLSWTQHDFSVFDNGGSTVGSDGADTDLVQDTWTFMELYANQAAGFHNYWTRKDGVDLHSLTGIGGNDWNWDYVWRVGWDRGGTSPPNPTMSIDDIYVDSALNRVMVGDASTYAASTHWEMLIPSVWSDTSITATFNQGSFGGTDTVYIYVFDSGNLVNSSGHAVTIDAASAGGVSTGNMSLR